MQIESEAYFKWNAIVAYSTRYMSAIVLIYVHQNNVIHAGNKISCQIIESCRVTDK